MPDWLVRQRLTIHGFDAIFGEIIEKLATMTKLEHVTLSDEAAHFAAALVAAGRFHSIDDVLAAGVDALQERDQLQNDWIVDARQRFEQGRTAAERGEVLTTTPGELMDGIEQELGIA